jgi:hypothetical protein
MNEATKMSDGQDWNNPIELSSIEWNNLDQMGRAEMTGYQAGLREERERIIKLLEGLKNFDLTSPQRIEHRMALEVMLNKLKEELIKGENK